MFIKRAAVKELFNRISDLERQVNILKAQNQKLAELHGGEWFGRILVECRPIPPYKAIERHPAAQTFSVGGIS